MGYKNHQYQRAESLIRNTNLFNGDPGGGIYRGKTYPFILNDNNNNIINQSRKAILEYFNENRIAWWNGRLTNHTLSSQIACLNHLFPIRENKSLILSFVKNINPDVIDVHLITSDKSQPAYIQFEAVSDLDHLNEVNSTRGSNCTSIDALIYGERADGTRILIAIEWKYVEFYGNEDKASGDKGATRRSRYTDLIKQSDQLNPTNHEVYYFEPFYQLMRQTLWAEQMIKHKNSETIKADDYLHIHVIPTENHALLDKTYAISGMGMEDTWRACLKNQNKYIIVSPQELLAPVIDRLDQEHLEYLRTRYW